MNECCKTGNEYDLIIIGGGAAAFAAAYRANQLKKRTLLINDKNELPLGGTCVNVGCVPSKIMLHQGTLAYYPMRNDFRALKLDGNADFVEALRETREIVEGFRAKNYAQVIEKQEYVEFQEGHAQFDDPHTIRVGDTTFKSKHILIATGASTFIPPYEGINDVDYLTNKNLFQLEKQPSSIIIIGAGPEGLELSQVFHHFGTEVTVLQRSSHILTRFEPDIADELHKHLAEEGITIHTDTTIKSIKKTAKGVEITADIGDKEEQRLSAERLVVSTGLSPHTDELGIEKSGVELNKRGFILVNNSFQTNQPHIYAAGDVTNLMPLETVAAKQGSTAVWNMFEKSKKSINYNHIPSAVFTSPEVATIGITEEEYMKEHGTCLCSTISLEHVEKAAAIKDTRGIIKMVVDHKSKVVIGVHIVGPMAADIITTATYAVKNKMTIDDIKDTVHVFPTMSEMVKKVAQSFGQDLNDMACCVE